ncbi:MAG: GNAT family N-acetyltransferase [Eubacterium sp.]|nr:GNAT family N-acetyltransferase [Eubacterium sp.]
MNINIRQANENDRNDIALCIAEGFKKDFDVLCKNTHTVATAINTGIQISKFYVAESQNKVVGVVAISDCNGRAVVTDISSYKKNFGFIKGNIANLVLKEEFESSLDYPPTTGYIEFVAVRNTHQRKGIATFMLKESMTQSSYEDYVLDVTDVNTAAIRCYSALGFKEFKRVEEKHSKQKGFSAKIYMRYKMK